MPARLQELLAKDWQVQTSRLKRCLREQDVLLEVALHKLDVHGGLETDDIVNFMWYGRSGDNLDPEKDVGPLQLPPRLPCTGRPSPF